MFFGKTQKSGDRSVIHQADKLHVVIMAGGTGTRFWPFSRKKLPKQFLSLGGDESLLRQTVTRLGTLVPPERVWVITNAAYVERVREEVPDVPASQVIGEPIGRNTAPCIALAAHRIAALDPEAALLVCPADHKISPEARFGADVRRALDVLSAYGSDRDPLSITFGIAPRYPATGFGYIERGEPLPLETSKESGGVYQVARFREKPEPKQAQEFVESGNFYWNSGIFVWSARGISSLIQTHLPDLATGIEDLAAEAANAGWESALDVHFKQLPSVSIDYGVLEHALKVAVVEATFEWDDVGSWAALEKYAIEDGRGNGVLGKHVGVETRNCLVVGRERLIATIGVEDLVIVETADALLVCKRDQTEKVKELVERLGEDGYGDLL